MTTTYTLQCGALNHRGRACTLNPDHVGAHFNRLTLSAWADEPKKDPSAPNTSANETEALKLFAVKR